MRPLPPGIQEALDVRTVFTPLIIVEASRLNQNPVLFEAVSGRVTFDARRTVYGDGEVVVPDNNPETPSPFSLLTPFGTRVAIDLGIILPSGASASVPAGRFVVDGSFADVIDSDPPARVVNMKLVDLSKIVADYRFEAPFTTPAGDLAATVNAVVADRTGTNPNLPATGISIGTRTFGLEAETDPWKELVELVTGFGYYLFYSREGSLNLTQLDYLGTPRTIAPLSLNSSFDRRPPNVVVARGESTNPAIPPVSAVAIDDDPASPTYAGTGPGTSPYGRITRFYASPQLTTVAQCQQAADSILARERETAATWTVTRAWDPTIEPFDVLADSGLLLGVDSMTCNFAGTITLEVRHLGFT